jgi:DNA replication protein DnaC
LRLTYIRDNVDTLAREARQKGQGFEDFLAALLDGELERRTGNGIARRILEAKFPIKKYLVDFNRSKYDPAFASKFRELETLQFIDNKENIILIGTPKVIFA